MARSAHGIDVPCGDHWATWAACTTNPNLWSSDSVQARQHATHVCLRHCPVLDQCRADTAGLHPHRRVSVVLAGVGYDTFGRPSEHLVPALNCGLCRGAGDCTARIHDTLRAYQDYGCRCPIAVEKKRGHWRRADQARRHRQRLLGDEVA